MNSGELDLIEVEYVHHDIIFLTETWLSEDISDDDITITHFQKSIRKTEIDMEAVSSSTRTETCLLDDDMTWK
jgi:hypothetical protein